MHHTFCAKMTGTAPYTCTCGVDTPLTPNTRPAEGRTSPQETKLAGNGETVADEAVERAAISPGAIEEASGEWVVLDPAGKEVARERSCARAWARVRGTYKTTVEGMAGLEEAGWRVIPLALDEETFVRERLAKLLAETVVVLRGPEPPLTRWGYHDIPQQVAALLAERDALTNKCSDAESSIRALRGKVGLASVLNKAYAVAVKHTQTKLKSAERELAELERRIAEAPVAEIVGITDGCEIIGAELDYRDEGDANAAKIENIIRLPGNARVRLLVEQQGDKG
jgi:hypothetical protein